MLARGGEDGLAVAPHARRERTAPHAPPRVERRPEGVAPLGGRLVAHLEQATAARAARVRIGLGSLATTGRADLDSAAHAPASFNTSLRIPPAVTAGPAPGPVITSGFFL